jgi:hypothetical protein
MSERSSLRPYDELGPYHQPWDALEYEGSSNSTYTSQDEFMAISNRLFGPLPSSDTTDRTQQSTQTYRDAAAPPARPSKRRRAEHEELAPVVIEFPTPLSAVERQVESTTFKDKERVDLLTEALRGVKKRLNGSLPENDPADKVMPSSKTSDEKLKKYLDYDQGIIRRPAHGESADQKEKREALNRYVWQQIAGRYENSIETAKKQYALAKGLIVVDGHIERPNTLFNVGFIWSPVFYYKANNTVYYGPFAEQVILHITSRNTIGVRFETPKSGPGVVVYRMAPRGYPTSPYEVERLAHLAKSPDADAYDRIGAHTVLRAFYQAVKRIDPSLYDDSMRHVLDTKIYNPEYYPSILKGVDSIVPFKTMPPNRVISEVSKNHGYGLPIPTGAFDIMEWCRYYLIQNTAGTVNSINGITMDLGGRVRIETVFGNRFVRMLSPPNQTARAAFTVQFAFLAARPNLYAEWIAQYNAENPGAPFHPAVGPPYTFKPVELGASASKNFTLGDLCTYLIKNGVPVDLIDHCYAFGRQFLDHVFLNFGRNDDAVMVDDERMDRLRRFGVPPTISEWTGWFTPSYEDVRRLKYFYHLHPTAYNLDNPYWVRYGADHLPVILVSRPNIPPFDPPVWGAQNAAPVLAPTGPPAEDAEMNGNERSSNAPSAAEEESNSTAKRVEGDPDEEMDAEGENETPEETH